MVTFDEITVRYGNYNVFSELNFFIPQNGVIAVAGKNGCGKTTLLHVIASIIKVNAGTITGLDDKRISMVFQDDRLLQNSTVLQNIKLCDDCEKSELIISRFGLDLWKNAYPSSLSGGMRRKVCLCRALCHNCDILLLDEPFKGLDYQSKLPFLKQIYQISKSKPVILVTHDIKEVKLLKAKVFKVKAAPDA